MYPWVLVELVVIAADVEKVDGNKLLVAVVVGPVGDSGRDGDDITLTDAAGLLVAVELFELLLLLLLAPLFALLLLLLLLFLFLLAPLLFLLLRRLLRLFESLRAPREHCP